jgi:hypothetical protein
LRRLHHQGTRLLNYVVAVISLLFGLLFTLYSLAAEGTEFSLGLMFGVLLLANAGLRVWAALDR